MEYQIQNEHNSSFDSKNNEKITIAPEVFSLVFSDSHEHQNLHNEKEKEEKNHAEVDSDETTDFEDNDGNAEEFDHQTVADEVQDNSNNQQSQIIIQNSTTVDSSLKRETNYFLRRTISLSLALSVAYFLLILVLNGVASRTQLFKVIYCYMFYFIIESVFRARDKSRDEWRKKEDLFNILDAICGVAFLFCVDLKLKGHINLSAYMSLPCLFTGVVYIFVSTAPNSKKVTESLARCLYVLNICFLGLHLEEQLDWEWILVLSPLYVLLAMGSIYFVAFLCVSSISMISFVISYFSASTPSESNNCVGHIWQIFYYGINIVGIFTTQGVCYAFNEEKNFRLLNTAATAGLFLGVVLTVSTLLGFNYLSSYLLAFDVTQSLLFESDVQDDAKEQEIKPIITVEKQETYFAMQTSTYFIPIYSCLPSNILNSYRSKSTLKKLKTLSKCLNIRGHDIIQRKPHTYPDTCYICCESTANAVLIELWTWRRMLQLCSSINLEE